MKNFVKAMNRESSGFAFLQDKFPRKSMEKLKAGIFEGPHIRELMNDPTFGIAQNESELSTWESLKSEVTRFQGNCQSSEYEK